MKKFCPFKKDQDCNSDCALFIVPDELNESVKNKLKSVGVLTDDGMCSIKNIAMAESRKIFDTSGRIR